MSRLPTATVMVTRRRRCGRAGGIVWFLVSCSVFALLLTVLPGPGGTAHALVPSRALQHAPLSSVTYSGVTGRVIAEVDGFGDAPLLGGVNVSVYSSNCVGNLPAPSRCPFLGSTLTNATGFFGFNLSGGTYYAAASPESNVITLGAPNGFGGGSVLFRASSTATVEIPVYPMVPYGNRTIVLPGWTCLSQYLYQFARGGSTNCQNPVLAWTQDGVFYVNASDELVFYSFVNASVTPIHAWSLLWQTFAQYGMVPNELSITQDGTYVYGWGTLSNASRVVTVEAVNVTTDRLFEHNFSGLNTTAVAANGQLQLTGWEGNDSLANLVLSSGQIVNYNLWNGTQWNGSKLDFFEANNVYWEPFLHGYVDVQADGSTNDAVEEWQLTGPSGTLVRTFEARWSSEALRINGVNGLSYNLSSHVLSFEAGSSAAWAFVEMSVDGAGEITGFTDVVTGGPSEEPFGPASASDRPTLGVSGPVLQGYYNGFFNNTFLAETSSAHLGFYSSNVSPYLRIDGGTGYDWEPWQQEGQFLNPSYLIAPDSYACADGPTFTGACSVNATGGTPGAVWWYWRLGGPEFPYPAGSRLAETSPPGPTTVYAVTSSPSSIILGWTPPPSFADPLVNYSIAWGLTGEPLTEHATAEPSNTSYTITGLEPDLNYSFAVAAWNLHGPGSSTGLSSATTVLGIAELGVTSRGNTSIGLSWVDPPLRDFTNISVEYGTAADRLTSHVGVGKNSSFTVSDLRTDTRYYFVAVLWNGSTATLPSKEVNATTLVPNPSNLTAVAFSSSNVTLTWSNPPTGEFTNVTVEYGRSVEALVAHLSVGTATELVLHGLSFSTLYFFDLVAWNGTDASPPTHDVSALTLAPSATELTVAGATATDVSLTWVLPPTGSFTNITLEYGTSSDELSDHLSLGVTSNWTVDDLAASTTYYFVVVAWNGTLTSLPSNEVSTRTQGPAESLLERAEMLAPWVVVPTAAAALAYFVYNRSIVRGRTRTGKEDGVRPPSERADGDAPPPTESAGGRGR